VTLRVVPITREHAEQVAAWRHPPPYDTYDVTGSPDSLLHPELRYHAVMEGEELIGYCCYGIDATVPNGRYEEGVLEVGWGMRPDLMGQGRGREFAAAIVGHAERAYRPQAMGVTIATFNERSQRVARANGFTEETGRFTGPTGMAFIQLRRRGGSGM
jgi:ribosomal-protein-alanine N-acetyltransferase